MILAKHWFLLSEATHLNIDLYSTSEIFYDASDLKKLADFEGFFCTSFK